jgi:hypothetical protein
MATTTPLEFMLSVMTNVALPLTLRLDAAVMAAPYMHPRMQAVVHAQESSGLSELGELIAELDGTSRGLPHYTDITGERENEAPESLDT